MGVGFVPMLALLLAATARLVTSVPLDHSVPASGNVAHATASFSVQQLVSAAALAQPFSVRSFKQPSPASSPLPAADTYNVHNGQDSVHTSASYSVQQQQQQLSNAAQQPQPGVIRSSKQPSSVGTADTYSAHHGHNSVLTSASYSVQQQPPSTAVQPISISSSKQLSPARSSLPASTYSVQQPQISVPTSTSYSVQQLQQRDFQAQQHQISPVANYFSPQHEPQKLRSVSTYPYAFQRPLRKNERPQSRSDPQIPNTAASSAPGHYSMAASYKVLGGQQHVPLVQRAAPSAQITHHSNHPMQLRKTASWMTNRRQHFEGPPGPHLSVPRRPPSSGQIYLHKPPSSPTSFSFNGARQPGPSFSGPRQPGPSFNGGPHSNPSFQDGPRLPGPSFNTGSPQLIYSKPPPEVIYYGRDPPPLDYSPVRPHRPRPVRPIVTSPVRYSSPQEPEDHDIMNDLDMYIPDDEPPSRTSSASSYSSPMSSMMMPLMLLGMTLPALGFAFTYLSKRRRRRRNLIAQPSEELDRYMMLLLKAIDKSNKSA